MQLTEYDVSLNCVFAWIGWAGAAILGILHLAYRDQTLGPLIPLFAAGAGTLHIRGFVCHLQRLEREAFERGREYAEGVRQLR